MDKMLQLAENYNKTLACLTKDLDVMSGTLRSIEQRLERTWQVGSHARSDSVSLQLDRRLPPDAVAEQYGREQASGTRSTMNARQRQNLRPSSRQ